MKHNIMRLLAFFSLLTLVIPTFGTGPSMAQGDSRTFPETDKTVKGRFLTYWTANGGLAQQGYPISEVMLEKSDTDGKTYTVQYFERAVFEMHPENETPNDVLLQLLGVFRYKQKYPSGAPQQNANSSADAILFLETGKHLGGRFLSYWQANGALAQQGYPISEEFQEKSDLDGKVYTVQYFERAVFELHSENQPPYDVLLSQLGTFRYRAKYLQPAATPTQVSPAVTATSTVTGGQGVDCSGLPASGSQDLAIAPQCAPAGSVFFYRSSGFQPGENISVFTTRPDGSVIVVNNDNTADSKGELNDWRVGTYTKDPQGIWAITIQGKTSGHRVVGYFKVTAPIASDCSGIPESKGAILNKTCVRSGEKIEAHVSGLGDYEGVTWDLTSPSGRREHGSGPGNPYPIPIFTDLTTERGLWVVSFGGTYSGSDVATGYYKVLAP